MRTILRFFLVMVMAAAGMVAVQTPKASAAMEPSFVVTCYPTGMAKNDPIVFPGQAGMSHMHSFFGAKGVNENTTAATLSGATSSQCGSYYDGVDLSAYWIPTLYKNGQQVYREDGSIQLRSYYQRAGGPDGEPVDQAWPRGLKIIAGDMHATSAQPEVLYFCANTVDTGRQSKGSAVFPSCDADETLVAKLRFPDCWDGRYLDSANHKSHMAYSSGSRNTCPSDHPVKIAQLTFEAWFYGVNGRGSDFSWASGGPYTLHGDVMSMWQPRAAANLVNQCINVAFDCNIFTYPNIPVGAVTQAQIDAQYTGVEPPTTGPTPTPTHTMTMPPSESPSPSMTPTHTMSMPPSQPPGTTTPTPTMTPTAPTPGTLTSDMPRFRAVGDTILTVGVNPGNWGPTPVMFSYQWLRNGDPIPGETGSTYDFKRADEGNRIAVRVTGSKSGYTSVTRTSRSLGPIWFPVGEGPRS